MNKKEQKTLCEDAIKIQKILEKGYYISEWINSNGETMYWLVKIGDEPYEGVFLAQKHNECKIGKQK